MKRYRIAFLMCIILLLAACQEKALPVTEEDVQPIGVPIEEITEIASHSWAVQDGENNARLYLTGDLFYVADETVGIAQDHLAVIDRDTSLYQQYIFDDKTILASFTSEGSLTMWIYIDGQMQQITFDEQPQLILTGNEVKFIEDQYLQTYYYTDEDDSIGWIYTTRIWDEENYSFTTVDTATYLQDDAFGWETGEFLTQSWHEHAADYVAFPHITLSDEFAEHVSEGMLLNNGIHLGMSIDKVLEESPDYLHHDYYEGGPYYSFPGGSSYFYDEVTREITFITLNGGMITNDYDSMLAILGDPIESGYDEMESVDYAIFHIGENRLKVESHEFDQVRGFWLTKQN